MTNDKYLTGFLTVQFVTDRVYLVHKINGRLSEMLLDDGDQIEVETEQGYKTVTAEEVLTTIVNKPVYRSFWRNQAYSNYPDNKIHGQSLYEGVAAIVTLNPLTTMEIQSGYKRILMNQLFEMVGDQEISHETAMEIISNWEIINERDKKVKRCSSIRMPGL